MRFSGKTDLIFPVKGPPPLLRAGYERDKKDPFRFHCIVKDCKHRGRPIVRQVCGGKDVRYFCARDQKRVTMFECLKCIGRKS